MTRNISITNIHVIPSNSPKIYYTCSGKHTQKFIGSGSHFMHQQLTTQRQQDIVWNITDYLLPNLWIFWDIIYCVRDYFISSTNPNIYRHC